RKLEKMLRGKEELEREGAGRALATLAALQEVDALLELTQNADLLVRCAALEVVERQPDPRFLPNILQFLAQPELTDVEERRALGALGAIFERRLTTDTDLPIDLQGWFESFIGPRDRMARALLVLHESGLASRALGEDGLDRAFMELCGDELARVRSAALHAWAQASPAAAETELLRAGREDASDEVRRVALRAIVRELGIAPDPESEEGAQVSESEDTRGPERVEVQKGRAERVAFVIGRLGKDASVGVREQAAVDLAIAGLKIAAKPLTRALEDTAWEVAVCAAVSLGRTHAKNGVEVLTKLAGHEDWRMRGAAAVGLGELNQTGIIEALLELLEDDEPAVARSAHEGLCRATGRSDVEQNKRKWSEWWSENGSRHVFRDRRAIAERRKKFGYSVPESQIYEGLDVVVLQSRGDHIETILARLGIEHRLTVGAQISECGLHSGAIFVSNCTGEVEYEDIERLEWFVRVGGSLFGSCWALSQTIERIYPGILAKYETSSEVMGEVRAKVLGDPGEHPFLRGAFSEGVEPIYHLEGAHLIEVLARERCEVLIDSAEAATHHGEGNLAAWFEAGHGVILDSVNHFDLQGLGSTIGLKTPEDRQAYAIDHLGLDYAGLREVRGESFWKSNSRASEVIWDESAFNLVTNFVRAKRLRDG
ncbi:MAG: HEAT repeat protein, partial [Planctomycetota bacterium]